MSSEIDFAVLDLLRFRIKKLTLGGRFLGKIVRIFTTLCYLCYDKSNESYDTYLFLSWR